MQAKRDAHICASLCYKMWLRCFILRLLLQYELAGVKDILSKSLGSNTKINMACATLNALKSQKTKEQVAALRGKKVEEI